MKIFFSGSSGLISTPEVLIPEKKPYVMLTFYDLNKGREGALCRLRSFLRRKKKSNENK